MAKNINDISLVDFIDKHKKDNIQSLLLTYSGKVNFDLKFAIDQIQALQKNQHKFPTFTSEKNILFPPDLNLQQSSSESTALYKADLLEGDTVADLTGGFGIDSWAFSKAFDEVFHIEPNAELQKLAQHNFNILGIKNVQFINSTAEEFIAETEEFLDAVFIDPSRRSEDKKVFNLEEYSPNFIALQDALFKKTTQILIKTSPFLDITLASSKLKFLKEIHIVAVKNEVKEVLYLLEKNYKSTSKTVCANLETPHSIFYYYSEEKDMSSSYSEPQLYLYEPNAAIFKSGAFDLISATYCIHKLHQNTHLYTSNHLVKFPGKVFEILDSLKYDLKYLKKNYKNKNISVSTRNFVVSSEELKKNIGCKYGNEVYLFGITDIQNKPLILICKRLS